MNRSVTVREESGPGVRGPSIRKNSAPVMGFNIDGGSAQSITIGAVGADRWEVEIVGKAAHAGVHPERGISATIVAARAWLQSMRKAGSARLRRGARRAHPTSASRRRYGRSAGQATNVVTDYVKVQGESRSHDAKFITAITSAYRQAFTHAATPSSMTREEGQREVQDAPQLLPIRAQENSSVVQTAQSVAATLGWQTTLKLSNGGLDANWLARHGIPALTFGAGQHDVHTIAEYADLREFIDGCTFALALATT